MQVRMIGGRVVQIPEDRDGRVDTNELRRLLGLQRGRALLEQRPTGGNVYLPSRGRAPIDPDSWLLDTPRAKRG